VLSLFFILYETLLPFQFRFSSEQLAADWSRITWPLLRAPDGVPSGGADLLGNVALFLPYGFCLTLAPYLCRSGRWRPLLLIGTGLLTSLLVETLQLFAPPRWTQTTDLMTNGIGTALGVLLALTVGRDVWDRALDWVLEKLRHDPVVLILGGLTAAIILGALLPLDLSIHRVSLQHHLQTMNLNLWDPLPAPGRQWFWLGLVKEAWLSAFWGAAAAQLLASRRLPLLQVLGWGALLVITAECGKLFVVSRSLSLITPLIAWCGCGLGAAGLLWSRQLGLTGRDLALGGVVGYAIYLICDLLSPLAPTLLHVLSQTTDTGKPPFQYLPFQAAAHVPTALALGEWSARLVRFLPLGAVLNLGLHRTVSRVLVTAGVVSAVLLLQLVRGSFSSWPGNITEVILAWAGIVSGWYLGGRLSDIQQPQTQA
jgi:glycopeptide antibiotics resistance protein